MNRQRKDILERQGLYDLFDRHIGERKILYIHGNTGYGKTASVLHWLDQKKEPYHYLSAEDNDFLRGLQEKTTTPVIILDDLSNVRKETEETQISQYIANTRASFVLISRRDVPPFLSPFQITGQMAVIDKRELAFTKTDVETLLQKERITLTGEELQSLLTKSRGLPLGISLTVGHLKRGVPFDQVYEKVRQEYFNHLDFALYRKLTDAQRNYLLDLASVPRFSTKLAIMLTGLQNIEMELGEITEVDPILTLTQPDQFQFSTSELHAYFLHKQKQTRARESILQLYQKIALYYELEGDFKQAMHYYSLGENRDKLSALLIENTKRNPLAARFHETEQYYFQLSQEQILSSPELMCGMSMLHSLRFSPEQSEYWYDKLVEFTQRIDSKDGRYKIAKDDVLFLDIALPHRGAKKTVDIIKNATATLFGKKSALHEVNATGDMPSLMNGGLDFSHWTKNDKVMYATMKKPLELVLGKSAVGLMDTGFGENLFEKNTDMNFTEALTCLNIALSEITLNGTRQMEFAALGVMARIYVASDSMGSATRLIQGYLDKVWDDPTLTMQANVEAMLTLFALYRGESKVVDAWMEERAPNELYAFYILKRYQYLVKARVYLLKEQYMEALSLLDRLKIYFERYHRPYGAMQTALLRAVTHYRMGDAQWQEELNRVLLQCQEYGFVRIVADEGIAVLEPLSKLSYTGNQDFYQTVITLTRNQAVLYPTYLLKEQSEMEPLTDMEKSVLRLMMQGMTNEKIGSLLGITLRTVKFHTGNIYSKMNVKNRAAAIMKAKETMGF